MTSLKARQRSGSNSQPPQPKVRGSDPTERVCVSVCVGGEGHLSLQPSLDPNCQELKVKCDFVVVVIVGVEDIEAF